MFIESNSGMRQELTADEVAALACVLRQEVQRQLGLGIQITDAPPDFGAIQTIVRKMRRLTITEREQAIEQLRQHGNGE